MHRQNPLQQGFVGYTSGGARALVDEISDNPLMQEMKGSFMGGENRQKVESPQNYGFTSVVMPATKGKNGVIEQCAEAYLSFLGGNRSFPVATVMDDRRFRLKELKPGDVAFFDHQQQQFHFNKDGAFLTGLDNKKIRIALHKVEQQQQSGGAAAKDGVSALAAEGGGDSSGSSSSSGSGGSQKKTGQKQRYEKAEKESKRFLDLNEKKMDMGHDGNIEAKAGATLKMEGTAISRKATTHYFTGDVHIVGDLYISKEAYKPTGPEWKPGTAQPGPTDADDVFEYVKRRPRQLSEGEVETFERQRTRALPSNMRIEPDGSIVIDGDFVVTGNLTVNGVVSAKGFRTIDA